MPLNLQGESCERQDENPKGLVGKRDVIPENVVVPEWIFLVELLAGRCTKRMMASKLTSAQREIVMKHSEDGKPAVKVCGKARISAAAFFNCRDGGSRKASSYRFSRETRPRG